MVLQKLSVVFWLILEISAYALYSDSHNLFLLIGFGHMSNAWKA
jgi:hypothetical protein